ncbi:MAG: hypothetical protein LBU39_12155 [Desulfobulbaceae bacterium]|nr:hypothetical protein [Desulfobulbaceae bacterium]
MKTKRPSLISRRDFLACLLRQAAACALGLAAGLPRPAAALDAELARGVVWQLDNAHLDPRGEWDKLGARELLIQWLAVEDVAFTNGTDLPAPHIPDWPRIARETWASRVILGLAGMMDERKARANIDALIERSLRIAANRPPLRFSGWYFPVEIDPTWTTAPRIAPQLNRLPRPLWVSVYDNSNIGGKTLADWLADWLPSDIGVFFQDGCGLHTRDAATARSYAEALTERLGRKRLRLIAEAFRPKAEGGFRAATANELRPQLLAYRNYPVYIFDGPHFLPPALVRELEG